MLLYYTDKSCIVLHVGTQDPQAIKKQPSRVYHLPLKFVKMEDAVRRRVPNRWIHRWCFYHQQVILTKYNAIQLFRLV